MRRNKCWLRNNPEYVCWIRGNSSWCFCLENVTGIVVEWQSWSVRDLAHSKTYSFTFRQARLLFINRDLTGTTPIRYRQCSDSLTGRRYNLSWLFSVNFRTGSSHSRESCRKLKIWFVTKRPVLKLQCPNSSLNRLHLPVLAAQIISPSSTVTFYWLTVTSVLIVHSLSQLSPPLAENSHFNVHGIAKKSSLADILLDWLDACTCYAFICHTNSGIQKRIVQYTTTLLHTQETTAA